MENLNEKNTRNNPNCDGDARERKAAFNRLARSCWSGGSQDFNSLPQCHNTWDGWRGASRYVIKPWVEVMRASREKFKSWLGETKKTFKRHDKFHLLERCLGWIWWRCRSHEETATTTRPIGLFLFLSRRLMSPHKLLSSLPTIYRAASNFVGRENCLRVDIPRDRMWSRRIDCQSPIKDRFSFCYRPMRDLWPFSRSALRDGASICWKSFDSLIHHAEILHDELQLDSGCDELQSLIFVTLVIRLLVVELGVRILA